ncbi:MAG: DUF4173 domain-containing protein [Actinobacteria bacterium]|nr:DUF4173 domain-containing protein [Actinomycetota bacterium]
MNEFLGDETKINNGQDQPIKQGWKSRFIIYGIITGTVFDILFYNKTLGISYPVFIIFLLILVIVEFRKYLILLNKTAWLFTVPMMLLSLTFFIYSNPVLKILNYLLIPLFVLVFIILLAKINKSDWSNIRFVGDIAKRIFVPVRFIHRPFTGLAETETNSKGGAGKTANRSLLKILTGILISVPIIALILWLLTSADLVFKDIFINIPLFTAFKHFLLIIVVAVYTACFSWALIKAFNERKELQHNRKQRKLFLDPTVIITILILTNIVYGVFSYVQFAYLFGAVSYTLPSSFTYAEYARRGFAELVVATVINFAILVIAITYVKKEAKKIFTVVRALLCILVIFTFVLLVSAFYRMTLYEQAYGFTYLRIFVQAFMVMLFFLFIVNIIYIWIPKLPIIKSYFVIALAVYIVLNFANVDVIIAKNNIARYRSTQQIDFVYLKGLSWDAVPEIKLFYKSIKDSKDTEEKQMAEDMLLYFSEKKSELEKIRSWQSFNISRHRAANFIIGS